VKLRVQKQLRACQTKLRPRAISGSLNKSEGCRPVNAESPRRQVLLRWVVSTVLGVVIAAMPTQQVPAAPRPAPAPTIATVPSQTRTTAAVVRKAPKVASSNAPKDSQGSRLPGYADPVDPKLVTQRVSAIRNSAIAILKAQVFRAELTERYEHCKPTKKVYDIDLRQSVSVPRHREMQDDGLPTSESSVSTFEYRKIGDIVYIGERTTPGCFGEVAITPAVWRAVAPPTNVPADAPDDRLVEVLRELAQLSPAAEAQSPRPLELFANPQWSLAHGRVSYKSSKGDFQILVNNANQIAGIASMRFDDGRYPGALEFPTFKINNVGLEIVLVDPTR
jgi:hypothetical protein